MPMSPLAGKPAPPSMLVNIPRLVTAYYTEKPDPAVREQGVAFGTSGYRGSAFKKTFNETHILAISQAICWYRQQQHISGPLFLGMDTHALALTRELGNPVYERIDAPATPAQKAVLQQLSPHQLQASELAGEKIQAILTTAPGNGRAIGGLKVITENGWFAARPSGTENVYKIYAESFRGVDHLRRIQEEAQTFIAQLFAARELHRSVGDRDA